MTIHQSTKSPSINRIIVQTFSSIEKVLSFDHFYHHVHDITHKDGDQERNRILSNLHP